LVVGEVGDAALKGRGEIMAKASGTRHLADGCGHASSRGGSDGADDLLSLTRPRLQSNLGYPRERSFCVATRVWESTCMATASV
jgi:hypothetical protein